MGSPGIQLDMKCSRFCSLFLYSAGGAVFCLGHKCFNKRTETVQRTVLSENCEEKVGDHFVFVGLWMGGRMVLLGPIQIVVIEECTINTDQS